MFARLRNWLKGDKLPVEVYGPLGLTRDEEFAVVLDAIESGRFRIAAPEVEEPDAAEMALEHHKRSGERIGPGSFTINPAFAEGDRVVFVTDALAGEPEIHVVIGYEFNGHDRLMYKLRNPQYGYIIVAGYEIELYKKGVHL